MTNNFFKNNKPVLYGICIREFVILLWEVLVKDIVKSFAKQIIFWLLLFTLGRIVFLIFYSGLLKGIDFISIIALFWHALRLDISAICFITFLPFLLLSIYLFSGKKILLKITKVYHYILIILYSLITTSETGIYGDWLTKLNVKAIKYLEHPGEIYNSESTTMFFILLIILVLQSTAGCLAYSRWFHQRNYKRPKKYLHKILFIVVSSFLLMIGVRGGFQQIPINQSTSYFSKRNILNLVAVNPAWNLMYSIRQNFSSLEKNPFIYYDGKEAKKNVDAIYSISTDTTEIFLSNPNPNILFVILEGWSASVIGSLGGEQGITPRFDSMVKNGIVFTHCYAPGFRSDQGMACIFSAFPATPLTTITRQPDKFSKLPFLTKRFVDMDYHTSYYFGGDLDYGNIKGYIYDNSFEKIVEGKDFSSSIPRGKLGVHDEFLYPRLIADLKNEQQPFFTALFTMSSHTPYDYPRPVHKFHYDWESDYANSMYYADSCLADFLAKAQKEEWYKNTLFIIVSDHGHGGVYHLDDWLPVLQRIPMLFYGDVIKSEFKGKKYTEPVSQVDIAATLLHQLGQKSTEFHWSKNLFNPNSKHFAYYAFEVGFGFVTPEGYVTFDCDHGNVPYDSIPPQMKDSIVKAGKSYLQELYQEYFDY